ncbi:MAG TPA: pyrimidine dimer DNA glycosylase/endonuclease V [bacterium]|mgnify:CR=1 FL=1|nr:pyrimidine dimer DNA glycosylase/endonuclease V [bacterium]HPL95834.1 pyrimidine dimer DNA glycosylase/endonuclease V [bacterium]
MRIWDIEPKFLCRSHLLGEHRELHAIWSVIVKNKKGYSQHPETKRWQGKLKALYWRHEKLVKEMARRGYQHYSFLDKRLARGKAKQNYLLDSLTKQRNLLKNKKCPCFIKTKKETQ